MSYSITKNGKSLDPSLYTIDEKTKTFSSEEDGLVFDFNEEYGWSFYTKSYNEFITGSHCSFYVNNFCSFETGDSCNFYTGSECEFETTNDCEFETDAGCIFKTGYNCHFSTYTYCVFNVQHDCSINMADYERSSLLDGVGRYIVYDGHILKINNKNDALLNMRHSNKFVRDVCRVIITDKTIQF